MNAGFGLIHDLAKIESDVRRELLAARHLVHCASMVLENADKDEIRKMLDEALGHLKNVAGA